MAATTISANAAKTPTLDPAAVAVVAEAADAAAAAAAAVEVSPTPATPVPLLVLLAEKLTTIAVRVGRLETVYIAVEVRVLGAVKVGDLVSRVAEERAESVGGALLVRDFLGEAESEGEEVVDPVKVPTPPKGPPLREGQLVGVGVPEVDKERFPPLRVDKEVKEAAGKAEVPRVRVEKLVDEGEEEDVFVGGDDRVEVGLAVEDLETKALLDTVSKGTGVRELVGDWEEEEEEVELLVPSPDIVKLAVATPLFTPLALATADTVAG